jgi:hypothetical protein
MPRSDYRVPLNINDQARSHAFGSGYLRVNAIIDVPGVAQELVSLKPVSLKMNDPGTVG